MSDETYYGVGSDEEIRELRKDEYFEGERRKGHRRKDIHETNLERQFRVKEMTFPARDCPARVLSGKHVLIVGKTGSGKTYWMSEICKVLDCFIFVNTQLERSVEKVTSFSTDTATEVVEALEEGYRKIEFIPSENDIEGIEQLEQIRRDLWAVAQEMKIKEGQWWTNFICDEAQSYAWLGSRTDLQNFARRGRRFGIKSFFISQQPQDLSKAIVNNCDWQVLFKLGQYSSIYFKNYKIPIEEHQGWIDKQYHYVIYNGETVSRCTPI